MQSSFISTPAHAGCPRLRGRLFRLLIVAADWLADMYRSMGRVKVWNMPRTQDSLRFGVARPWFTVSAVTNSPWCIKTVNKLFLLKTSSPLLTSSLPQLTSDQIFLHTLLGVMQSHDWALRECTCRAPFLPRSGCKAWPKVKTVRWRPAVCNTVKTKTKSILCPAVPHPGTRPKHCSGPVPEMDQPDVQQNYTPNSLARAEVYVKHDSPRYESKIPSSHLYKWLLWNLHWTFQKAERKVGYVVKPGNEQNSPKFKQNHLENSCLLRQHGFLHSLVHRAKSLTTKVGQL